MCVRGKGKRVGGWGSCDPTAPRPAPTQAHAGAPLTRHELVEASPRRGGGLGRSVARAELSLDVTPEPAAAFTVSVSVGVLCNRSQCRVMHVDLPTGA